MRIAAIICFLLIFSSSVHSQQQQIALSRIDQMPDMPSPYLMRDWKRVAELYDTLIFSMPQEGTYFPLMSLGNAGVNYPEIKPIFLDSYVGSSSHGQQRESINIIPAIVGASLIGLDKKTQFATDWVDKARDFYNLKNGELVYLNGPSDQTGNDWWYETMPNIFFYQLYDLYPNTPGFGVQFRSVADRWLEAVEVMGGGSAPWSVPQMNYRAWDLKTMQPLVDGVKEPEAAGAIAWILYQAYKELGDKKYLIGAQWSMEFLNGLESNPSYELQLPYGVLAAARMNAEIGTNYDVEKMLNWCFTRGDLRGWGSIVGNWGGTEVSGLIGEANDQGNDYAFIMNGFQLAAAVVPLLKYDKRFASSIAKWVLNVSNASRLFYASFVPTDHQSDYDWSAAQDPNSVIAYESIKESWQGKSLFSRGDSKDAGWASTNFGLYGSSHVGYLGAIASQTNVDGILKLDANATDFFGENSFPTYVIYNPFGEAKQVNLNVGNDSKDIYDAISETIILQNVSGIISVTIPAKESVLISYVPAGSVLENVDGQLLFENSVLDFHYGYDFNPELLIKSISATNSLAEIGLKETIYCTVDFPDAVDYQWLVDGVNQNTNLDHLIWTPNTIGISKITVVVRSGTKSAMDSLQIEVVDFIPLNPVVDSVFTKVNWHYPNEEIWVVLKSHDPKNLDLTYNWTFDLGQILESKGDSVNIKLPNAPGVFSVNYTISNSYDKSIAGIFEVLVVENISDQLPLIYLPFDNNVLDRSGNGFETILQGTSYTSDPRKEERKALGFTISSDELRIPNAENLNFTEAITVSFWLYLADHSEERFIISHGGWEQRWKASVTPTGHFRWTVNTTDGIRDLDSTFPIEKFEWVHFTMIYSGSSMQLYINGVLNSFLSHSGAMNPSNLDLTIGKRRPGDDQYYLKGRVDEVKIFDRVIGPEQTGKLKEEWLNELPLAITSSRDEIKFYPNPASNHIWLMTNANQSKPLSITIYDMSGRKCHSQDVDQNLYRVDVSLKSGIYSIRINGTGSPTYTGLLNIEI
jgi:hypothetical protein